MVTEVPSVQMYTLPLPKFPNMHRAKPMKETQKRAETFNRGFIYNGEQGVARKEQSYPIIRNAVCTKQKALIQFLLKEGPTDRRTPKRNERDLPASCDLRRDERTRPASRCDQPSASEMRPAQHRREMRFALKQTRRARADGEPGSSDSTR